MILGVVARKRLHSLSLLVAASALSVPVQPALAQAAVQQEEAVTAQAAPAAAEVVAAPVAVEGAEVAAEAVANGESADAAASAEGYTPLGPEWIRGAPESGAISFQNQYSPEGRFALWFHNGILLPLIAAICVIVLLLLLWVVARYNRRANPVPSKTSHNTLIEVIWTALPVLILVAVAIPSITLLSRQYRSPPADALTIKATGYQWYWGYSYPDNGGFEVISNMMPEEEALAKGLPPQLEADKRMVVPVGEPIRLQTTGADVIHAFAVPSLWFKIDAVPGRINERTFIIEEPGIYYGQCMELCGARHGYMPIAIEALPRPQFEAWVRAQGGTVGDAEVVEAAVTPAAEETPADSTAPSEAAQGEQI